MKLEVPHLRIMKGEAGSLSPAAKGVLLSLIACQDQFTKTISWSKAHIADISNLDLRTVYRALSELDKANWITRNHQLIQLVITTHTNSDTQATTHTNSDTQATNTAKDNDTDATLDDTQAMQSAIAMSDRSDQIDLKDHDSNRKARLVMSIGEKYELSPGRIKQLWSICEKADFKQLSDIFEKMINHRTGINDPISYISVSLSNSGNGQKTFTDFLAKLP